ncbi:hypothetical protein CKAH01_16333 [Colletotrichum kahawae]|uniref:Uncharacterized protein n=1 Tax=Colletotrichum kahawae TaxID=34407 RepID=A0AAD9YFX0_COLKA|nr:hypothetical protein CKAH01_16333 [Colletotrichum kahawae]
MDSGLSSRKTSKYVGRYVTNPSPQTPINNIKIPFNDSTGLAAISIHMHHYVREEHYSVIIQGSPLHGPIHMPSMAYSVGILCTMALENQRLSVEGPPFRTCLS